MLDGQDVSINDFTKMISDIIPVSNNNVKLIKNFLQKKKEKE